VAYQEAFATAFGGAEAAVDEEDEME